MRARPLIPWILAALGPCLTGVKCDGDDGIRGFYERATASLDFWKVGCWQGYVACDGKQLQLLDGRYEATACQEDPAPAQWPVPAKVILDFSWMSTYSSCEVCWRTTGGSDCKRLEGTNRNVHWDVGTPRSLPDAGPGDVPVPGSDDS
jgi:hypothetical protein